MGIIECVQIANSFRVPIKPVINVISSDIDPFFEILLRIHICSETNFGKNQLFIKLLTHPSPLKSLETQKLFHEKLQKLSPPVFFSLQNIASEIHIKDYEGVG